MIPMNLMLQIILTMMMTMSNSNHNELVLILTAAGSSTRMGNDHSGHKIKKEYLPLKEGTVLSTAAKAFLSALDFSLVIVTYPFCPSEEENRIAQKKSMEAMFSDKAIEQDKTKFLFIPGGKTRQSSVFEALKLAADFFEELGEKSRNQPIVFIHDGARPFVSSRVINDTLNAAIEFGAAVPGLQPVDTQKEIDANGFIVRHLVRKNLIAVQTPQVFNLNAIIEAHKKAAKCDKEFTDDTEIWDEFVDLTRYSRVKVVAGDSENKKITYRSDIFRTNERN